MKKFLTAVGVLLMASCSSGEPSLCTRFDRLMCETNENIVYDEVKDSTYHRYTDEQWIQAIQRFNALVEELKVQKAGIPADSLQKIKVSCDSFLKLMTDEDIVQLDSEIIESNLKYSETDVDALIQ